MEDTSDPWQKESRSIIKNHNHLTIRTDIFDFYFVVKKKLQISSSMTIYILIFLN